jgi:hypothetical protein
MTPLLDMGVAGLCGVLDWTSRSAREGIRSDESGQQEQRRQLLRSR